MELFSMFFRLGFSHITDPNGYDHILFVATLCLPFALAQWRQLLWLITAFTLGHSLTLALSMLDWVRAPSYAVELGIAISIFISAVMNIWLFGRLPQAQNNITQNGNTENGPVAPGFAPRYFGSAQYEANRSVRSLSGVERAIPGAMAIRYTVATLFGLLHGLGFSNYLRSLLGQRDDLWQRLLAFNIGLEIGQLFITCIVMVLAYFWIRFIGTQRWFMLIGSICIACIALWLVLQRV
jgi:hypothetical protein